VTYPLSGHGRALRRYKAAIVTAMLVGSALGLFALQHSELRLGSRGHPDPSRSLETGLNLTLFACGGLLIGLLVGTALALLLDALRRRLVTAEDVERATGLRVVGAVPAKSRRDDPLAVLERPLGSTAEGFHWLRMALERLGVGRDRRVVAVLSADDGEGRSTVAANLALCLARQGHSVVLVCADLRGGGADKLFGLDPSGPGLASVLQDGGAVAPTMWSVLRSVTGGLLVLAPGRPRASPAELLASPDFEQVLAELRRDGAVVVLDTPPASWSADALLAAGVADGTLLVTRARRSRRRAVAKMVTDLRAEGFTPLGIVMVGTRRPARLVRKRLEQVADAPPTEVRPVGLARWPAAAGHANGQVRKARKSRTDDQPILDGDRTSRTAASAPRARTADLALYRRLFEQVRPYRPHIAVVFLLSLLASPLALLTPVPLKMAVDSVLGSEPVPRVVDALLPAAATSSPNAILLVATGLVIVVALLSQLQTLGSSLLSTYTGERLVLSFRRRLFRHVQRLSVSYHDEQGTTYSTYRIQYDAPAIQYIAIDGLIPFITASVTLVVMLFVVLRIDLALGLVALAISPILFLISRIYRRRLRRQSREAKALETSALSVAQEVLAALRVVKAFGQEDYEQERFMQRSSQGMRARIRLAFQQGAFALLVGLTTAVGTGAVLYIGIRHVQLQILTLGDLLLVMGYLTQLYAPLKTVSKKVADLQSWLASAERAFSLLDEVQDVPERPDARPLLHRAVGAVAFRNVSFAYTDRFPVLHDLSFDLDPHVRLGIAGLTGSGKTTLVSLLTRFYDPTAGCVLLDGVDLRDYKLADLRNQFALVLQEPVLFSASIAENIAYACPGTSQREIVAAAEAASAHGFITRLPEGYDTQVGERGMRLSGGERQRLALARAFLKDAPILVLDEPTSSVDSTTEAMIVEALERLMHDRTTVLISHRESTLRLCDVRIELARGEIVSRAGT
jgi:ATP-binding cassette subfamily B protein